jgi:hypothetical protein
MTETKAWPFASGNFQIFVQVNNHILTPDNPTYPGGQWHVEGLLNENITESRLSFRARESDRRLDQDDQRWRQDGEDHSCISPEDLKVREDARREIYGDEEGLVNVGSVRARTGQCVGFPNVLAHKVEPFQLADATRPGYRKTISIFLVDPALSILSTSRVPPQQAHWAPYPVASTGGSPCPYNMGEANEIRAAMLLERGAKVGTGEDDDFMFYEPCIGQYVD